jgi:hypothetical protein
MLDQRTGTARNLREANPPTAESRNGSFSGKLFVTDTLLVERHLGSFLRAELLSRFTSQ